MASSSIVIRKLVEPTSALIEQATRVMTEAFLADPFSKAVTGNSPKMLETLKRAQLLSGQDGGEIWVAEDSDDSTATAGEEAKKIVGCAVWFGPGRAMFDTDEQKKVLLGPFMAGLDPEVRTWWTSYFLPTYAGLTSKTFGTVPSPTGDGTIPFKLSAWHLQTVGVLPEYRKKGITRGFIDALKEKVTAEGLDKGVPLCLEAITEGNSIIYSRLGFINHGEGSFTAARDDLSGFKFWCMTWGTSQNSA